jgi:hypothetical protein
VSALVDVYRDAFLRFLAEGKSHLEALREFNHRKLHDALRDTLDTDEGRELLDLLALAGREECDEKETEKAIELWLAGWTSDLPEQYKTPEAQERAKNDPWSRCAVMSWYWRAPSKRKGRPGRRYLSTSQAHNAMRRATP